MVSSAEKCSVLCVIIYIILCNIPLNLRLGVDGLYDSLNYTCKYIISQIKLSSFILFLFNFFFIYIMRLNISTEVPLVPTVRTTSKDFNRELYTFFFQLLGTL